MLILGLESSCDETAAAVVEDGYKVLSNVVASQYQVHTPYGGVVPELASRSHVVNAVPVLRGALEQAGVTFADIEGIAVTQGPGLVGALLVALQLAKALAYACKLPLIGVNHIEGHLTAVYLTDNPPPFPHLALVVSGGHTSIMRLDGHGMIRELGATRDDAAGEAFDKVAKLLGLGYPGGIAIDRLAKEGDPTQIRLPRAMTANHTGYDFSFSGLKTAVLNYVHAHGVPEGQGLADLCASFQAAVVEVLVRKTTRAARSEQLHHVQICGGVAANSLLRAEIRRAAEENGFTTYIPAIHLCTDNAAMIAAAGYHRLHRGERSSIDLAAYPSLPLSGLLA